MWIVEIPDKPIPLQRARGSKGRFYDPQHEVKQRYAKYVMENILPVVSRPLTGPLKLLLIFHFGVPKSWSKKKSQAALLSDCWHVQTPDIDNLAKFFLDSLNGILWEDDRQIYDLRLKKIWSERPRTEVILSEELI